MNEGIIRLVVLRIIVIGVVRVRHRLETWHLWSEKGASQALYAGGEGVRSECFLHESLGITSSYIYWLSILNTKLSISALASMYTPFLRF